MRKRSLLFLALVASTSCNAWEPDIGGAISGVVEKGKEVVAGLAEAVGADYTVDESTRVYVRNASKKLKRIVKTAAEEKQRAMKIEIIVLATAEQKKLKNEIMVEMQAEQLKMKREIKAIAKADILKESQKVIAKVKIDIYGEIAELKESVQNVAGKVGLVIPDITTNLEPRFDEIIAKVKNLGL